MNTFFDANIQVMANEWKKNYLTAIIVIPITERGVSFNEFKKYRNIHKKKVAEFQNFARTEFTGAKYVNYYERYDRSFVERVYL